MQRRVRYLVFKPVLTTFLVQGCQAVEQMEHPMTGLWVAGTGQAAQSDKTGKA